MYSIQDVSNKTGLSAHTLRSGKQPPEPAAPPRKQRRIVHKMFLHPGKAWIRLTFKDSVI